MANVKKYLQDILDAIYGEEVRGSIHDAIDAMNEESTNAEAVAISSRDSAKHNAEAAEESATEAAASETAAKTSETNAKASETAAKASETAAKASETAAKRSENNASDSEDAAYESEQNAKASENAAKDSEDAAANSESAARTYSMQAFEYKHDAQESAEAAYQYEQQCEQIRDDIGYPIDPKGTVTFANLPSVATAQIGWMYNVSDDFTTTSDFEEGAGKFYSAGSEVYLNSNNKWSVMAGPGVTGIKGEAETTYHKGQVNLTKSMLGINTLDDISTPEFTQAATRTNINSGELISTIMGKIKKFFADLKTVAFTGNASDVSFDSTGTTSSATTVQAGLKEALTNSAPTASDVPYDNTTSGLDATNVQDAIDEVNSKSMPSYVGMLDISTVNDTLEKVQAIYGANTTWIQHSGYVLRGATSGVTANSNIKDGGADSAEHAHTIAHTHTMAHTHTIAHTHTMAHTHTIAHTHTYAHTHGVPAHSHTLSAKGWAMITTGWYTALWTAMKTKTGLSWKSNQQGTGVTGGKNQGAETKTEGAALDGETDSHAAMKTNSQSESTTSASSSANSGAASNATTSASSAANSGAASNATTSASSAANSGSTTINILPSYKSVYIWERTA